MIAPVAADSAPLVILTGDKDALTLKTTWMAEREGRHDKRAVKMFGGWEELSFMGAGRAGKGDLFSIMRAVVDTWKISVNCGGFMILVQTSHHK